MPLASQRTDIGKLNISVTQAHAGLWLDRMVPKQMCEGDSLRDNEKHPHTSLIEQACNIPIPKEYNNYFIRWKAALSSQGATCREGQVRGRMVVGLGAESVLETAITLHRTYGVPYIPGSALKGLAAAYAHQRLEDDTWRKPVYENGTLVKGQAHRIMFGDTTSAGYVTFFDALYVPGTGHQGKPLWPDVITVHHPLYYQEQKDAQGHIPPPADWDSPTPISFVTATGAYLIALGGPAAWVEAAYDILALALDQMGVGAKTSSGYGRMTLEGLDQAKQRWEKQEEHRATDAPKATPPTDPEQQMVATMLSQIQALPPARVATEINRFYQQWKNATVREELRQQVAQAIIEKVREAKREAQSQGKGWYQELLASVQGS